MLILLSTFFPRMKKIRKEKRKEKKDNKRQHTNTHKLHIHPKEKNVKKRAKRNEHHGQLQQNH